MARDTANRITLESERVIPSTEEARPSIIGIIDTLITDAFVAGASDIHIDPGSSCVAVRFRVDGLLRDERTIPAGLHLELLSRIKILAGLRTDEHRKSQDGRFRFTVSLDTPIDIRVSIVPTYHGENAVLRLLVPDSGRFTLKELGCQRSHRTLIEKALARSHGLVLACGPTGSGKTTMLYALVRMLDSKTRSIITIEDPIEYSLPGITQIPADPAYGITFANGLRSILRQDPDIILVGEMRDSETARLASNAALTGHLVFSTLHTNDAGTALPRLLDMGIEPYLIASTVNLIIAQRLVRRLCPGCKQAYVPDQAEQEYARNRLGAGEALPASLFRGNGCDGCSGTGYAGRIGIYEILLIDDRIRESLLEMKDVVALRRLITSRGMVPMRLDGLSKAARGETSLEEVLRISYV